MKAPWALRQAIRQRSSLKKTPVEIVDELAEWLHSKIGDIAEDDWLLLDDFEGYCQAVKREWEQASRTSVANPEVKKELLRRCSSNLRLAEAAFSAIVGEWLKRR